MVSTLQWVVVGFGVYWLALIWLQHTGRLPAWVGTQGPLVTLHTRRFREFVDRVASPKRLWRAWGNFGLGVALVVMVGSFAFFLFGALETLENPPPTSAINQPRNVLVIPGVNDFLPLSVAPEIVAGLAIGIVVHEGGHAIMCRVGDIDIESMGLAFLAVLPLGAFVEPDEESRNQANRGGQSRMFAAGVMNNFAITLLAFGLLFGPVVGAIHVAPGAPIGGVLPNSAAEEAGVQQGDRFVAINGRRVANFSHLGEVLEDFEEPVIRVRLVREGEERTIRINRTVLVTGILRNATFYQRGTFAQGTRIVSVNGTAVGTEQAFREAVGDRRIARLETAKNATVTVPVGAAVTVQPDGPLARADAPVGRIAFVTAVAGERVANATAFGNALDRVDGTTTIEAYVDGEFRTYEVDLSAGGFRSSAIAPGVSGITTVDVGVTAYPADTFLGLLGGRGDISFFRRIVIALQLPLAGLVGAFAFNFAGFTGFMTNFYAVPGLPDGLVFGLANLLYWTGWINLNLAVFNCIPAFPLDGGHLLRASTEAITSRLPTERRRTLTTAVTTSVGLTMLFALLVTLFGPRFL